MPKAIAVSFNFLSQGREGLGRKTLILFTSKRGGKLTGVLPFYRLGYYHH
jgi:hypothetical protein